MAELFGIINQQEAKLASPLTITEPDGVVTVVELTTTALEEGNYEATVSFVSSFTSVNDQLHWNVGGTDPSPSFLHEAKDALEVIPFTYTFTTGAGFSGVLNMILQADITGVGQADVVIENANLLVKRVG